MGAQAFETRQLAFPLETSQAWARRLAAAVVAPPNGTRILVRTPGGGSIFCTHFCSYARIKCRYPRLRSRSTINVSIHDLRFDPRLNSGTTLNIHQTDL